MSDTFQVQTRDEDGRLEFFGTLEAAMAYADSNPDVWKVSFPVGSGERCRLVRGDEDDLWYYEPIDLTNREVEADIIKFAREDERNLR